MTVTRDEARTIAEDYVVRDRSDGIPAGGTRIRGVLRFDELQSRPWIYGFPKERPLVCWVAYVDRSLSVRVRSQVILVDDVTGEVLYAGPARDEI